MPKKVKMLPTGLQKTQLNREKKAVTVPREQKLTNQTSTQKNASTSKVGN